MSQRRDIVHQKPELELKVAARALIRSAGGTDGAAETLGTRQQRMSDCGLPNTPDFLRIDEAARLEDVTVGQAGWPHVTRALAHRQGFELVPAPAHGSGDVAWGAYAARLLKETGDVLGGLGQALESGGDVDSAEAAPLLPEADELVQLAVELRQALRRRAEGRD